MVVCTRMCRDANDRFRPHQPDSCATAVCGRSPMRPLCVRQEAHCRRHLRHGDGLPRSKSDFDEVDSMKHQSETSSTHRLSDSVQFDPVTPPPRLVRDLDADHA